MRKTKKFSPGQPSLFGLSTRQCLDQRNRRKLFVALSRARLHAVLITSERAKEALFKVMDQD